MQLCVVYILSQCNYGVRFDGPYGVDFMMAGLAKELQKRMMAAGVWGSKLVLKIMKSKDASKLPGKFLGHGSCESISRSVDIPLTRDWGKLKKKYSSTIGHTTNQYIYILEIH